MLVSAAWIVVFIDFIMILFLTRNHARVSESKKICLDYFD